MKKLTHRMCGRLLAGVACAAALAGCTSSTMPGAAAEPAVAQSGGLLRWQIDNVERIGGNKPTVMGTPTVSGTRADKAVHFDGVKDGLILPVVPVAGMEAFTVEVLFRPASGGAAEQRFMHSEDEAGNRFTIETRLTPDGKWALDTFLLAGASRRSLYDAAKLHPADQWYWVALRYDGTTMSDFVNGVKELEGPVVFGPMGATGRVSLGMRLNQVNWFKGEIREVRVTPRAVAEGELQRVGSERPPIN